jgi:hypothetical protein
MDCGNWRPICLLSAIYKTFSGLLAKRLQTHNIKLRKEGGPALTSNEQRGFVSGIEGCSTNSFVLKNIIQSSRKNSSPLGIAWIDFRNAFGSIDHKVIKLCMKWLRVPTYITELVASIYHRSSFQVKLGDTQEGWTMSIVLERGVKQGDGLSPVIFNLTLELLLRWLLNGTGVEIAHINYTALGYADDIALANQNAKNLAALFAKVEAFGMWANIDVKPAKCATLAFDKNGKAYDPMIETSLGKPIPYLKSNESYRFLGTEIDAKLRYKQVQRDLSKTLTKAIHNLHAADLDGWQKMDLFRQFVMPKLTFPFATANIPLHQLQAADRKIRVFFRSCLSLTPNACNALFYNAVNNLGLGHRSLEDEYKRLQATTAVKAILDRDQTVQSLAASSYEDELYELLDIVPEMCDIYSECIHQWSTFGNILPSTWLLLWHLAQHHSKSPLKPTAWLHANSLMMASKLIWKGRLNHRPSIERLLDNDQIESIPRKSIFNIFGKSQQDQWFENWKSLEMQGEVARRLSTTGTNMSKHCPESAVWIRRPWLLSNREYSWAIKTHLRIIPSATNLFQWKLAESPMCKQCHSSRETTCHALNGCEWRKNNGLYTTRHNKVLEVLIEACRESGRFDQVAMDQPIRSDAGGCGSSLRPDLHTYDNRRKTCTVLDVKCPFQGPSLSLVHTKNYDKYKHFIRQAKRRKWLLSIDTYVITSSGIAYESSKIALRKLGFKATESKAIIEKTVIACIKACHSSISPTLNTTSKCFPPPPPNKTLRYPLQG